MVARRVNRRLFDVVVVVDWSANAAPKRGRDSIWCCVRDATTGGYRVVNHPTRAAARAAVREVLIAAEGRRVLVGFDFALGYPAGTAAAAGLHGAPPWRAMWDHLVGAMRDGPCNENNRFEVAAGLNERISTGPGPFWGVPVARATSSLTPGKAPGFPHGALAEHRVTETRLRAAGSRVASVWQLLGAGSVGGQTLTGIPVVAALCADVTLAPRSNVWPFTTGLTSDPTAGCADAVVHAEIWPGSAPFDGSLHEVRDAAQVIGLARHLATLDEQGALAARFAPALPRPLVDRVLDEEGWVLLGP
jgi:precorrin-8X/cobalt-precorrin-8 methylmutase